MKKILLIEDDKEILNVLSYILKKEYIIYTCQSIKEATNLINTGEDLVILDVCLPDGKSFDISSKIKSPIIFLTALDSEDIVVKCLNEGEEYIAKPFKTKELLLRIDKILKRCINTNIHYKDVIIDTHLNKVYVKDKEINITHLDYKIIEFLFRNIGTIISRDKLSNLIYDTTSKFVEDNSISVYIKRVRDKLGNDYIKTIKKVGYLVEKI